jgi:hypothetical protein
VGAVLRAHDWFEAKQIAEWWGDDPEWWLVEGLHVYQAALSRTRVDELKRKK